MLHGGLESGQASQGLSCERKPALQSTHARRQCPYECMKVPRSPSVFCCWVDGSDSENVIFLSPTPVHDVISTASIGTGRVVPPNSAARCPCGAHLLPTTPKPF